MRRLIKCDGTMVDYDKPVSMTDIYGLIDCVTVDAIALRQYGTPLHVMLVDDLAYETKATTQDMGDYTRIDVTPTKALKPLNAEATRLYHANCLPGTTHQIAGDVFVCPDEDFA